MISFIYCGSENRILHDARKEMANYMGILNVLIKLVNKKSNPF